jgi:Gas vesicle protein
VTVAHPERTEPERRALGDIALVDLLDRLLGVGVVLAGDVVISLAGVDLVQVRLHALITSVRADMVGTSARAEASHDG